MHGNCGREETAQVAFHYLCEQGQSKGGAHLDILEGKVWGVCFVKEIENGDVGLVIGAGWGTARRAWVESRRLKWVWVGKRISQRSVFRAEQGAMSMETMSGDGVPRRLLK